MRQAAVQTSDLRNPCCAERRQGACSRVIPPNGFCRVGACVRRFSVRRGRILPITRSDFIAICYCMMPDRLGSVGFARPSLGLDLGQLQDAPERIAVDRPLIVKRARPVCRRRASARLRCGAFRVSGARSCLPLALASESARISHSR